MSRFMSILLLLLAAMPAMASPGLSLRVAAGDGHGHVRRHFVYRQCGGDDVSPRVHWQGVPAGTRSFVLTTFDPDANDGAGWWHWVVVDLPAATTGLGEGASLPPGASSLRNDFGDPGWGGPCPPAGDPPHHYVFTLYALDVARLPLSPDATPKQALHAMHGHVLATARVTFLYGR
jgi:hypothetical protein